MSFIKKIVLPLFIILLLGALYWLLNPIYLFFAYKDGSTLPAEPWLMMPATSPQHQQVFNKNYQGVGEQMLVAMEDHRDNIGAPAISAAVVMDNQLVWAGSRGWADISQQQSATPQTRFRVGSTAKALTATGLARLLESGALTLDTPVGNIFEQLPNPAWATLTPRQLASHMSGMPHYKGNTEWLGMYHFMALTKHFDNVHEAVELFDETEMLFAPGEQFSYSSLGTVLLSAAMSQSAQQPYLALMQQHVFGPNQMDGVIVAPGMGSVSDNISTPYHHNGQEGDNYRVRQWGYADLSHRLAGGGFAATPTDLVKLANSYFGPDAIDETLQQALWTPQKLNSGDTNPQNYAIGWRVGELNVGEFKLFQANHGGVSRGGQSWLMLIPEHKMALAFTINSRTDRFADFGLFYKELGSAFIRQKLALETKQPPVVAQRQPTAAKSE